MIKDRESFLQRENIFNRDFYSIDKVPSIGKRAKCNLVGKQTARMWNKFRFAWIANRCQGRRDRTGQRWTSIIPSKLRRSHQMAFRYAQSVSEIFAVTFLEYLFYPINHFFFIRLIFTISKEFTGHHHREHGNTLVCVPDPRHSTLHSENRLATISMIR